MKLMEKWTNLLEKYDQSQKDIDIWNEIIWEVEDKQPMFQLNRVNSLVNSYRYISDPGKYRELDYWATPEEFFQRNSSKVSGGDCEDFAIVKYFTLKRLGWDPKYLWLAILFDKEKRRHHAVLLVEYADKTLILDNQIRRVVEFERTFDFYQIICRMNEEEYEDF